MEKLKPLLLDALDLVVNFKEKQPIRSGTDEALIITAKLKYISGCINEALLQRGISGFRVKATHGNGYLPSLLWISIVPEKMPRSASMSDYDNVVIVIEKNGKGLVCGLVPKLYSERFKTVVLPRDKGAKDFLDFKASSPLTSYTDRFHNPLLVSRKDIKGEVVFNHLVDSLKLIV